MSGYLQVVDGLTLPAPVGGHPTLDFCNTWAGWDGEATWEYLADYEHLAVWAGSSGLLPAERIAAIRRTARRDPAAAASIVERARSLRSALYEVLTGSVATGAFGRVADAAAAGAGSLRLQPDGERIMLTIGAESGLAAPCHAVAWSAAQLLSSDERALVRACPGHGCGWLFLDRRGRRRWCVMSSCGNRAKARRFAARQRSR